MINVNEHWAKVANYYPYRTAMVGSILIEIERNSDAGRQFEAELAKASEVRQDNHTVYEIRHKLSGESIYVLCSDMKISIGTKLVEGRW